jgi:multiple sugar transport system substrate-binding protein
MVKRHVFCLVLAFILVGAFAYAAGEQEEGGEMELAGKKLTVLTQSGDANAEKMVARAFEEKTGAEVTVESVPFANLYERIITASVAGGKAYDIVEFSYTWAGTLMGEGHLAPLVELVGEDYWQGKKDDFFPRLLEVYGTWDDTLYGVPSDGDIQILYYRKDLLNDEQNKKVFEEEYGYELVPPKTWKQYNDVAEFFTRGKGEGNPDINYHGVDYGTALMATRGDYLIGLFLSRFASYLPEEKGTLNGVWLDDNYKPLINGPEGKKALTMLKEAVNYSPPGTLSFSYMEVKQAFNQGTSAMCEQWTGIGDQDPEQSEVVGNVGYTVLPKGEDGEHSPCMAGGWALGVMKNSEKKGIASEYLKFRATKDIQMEISLAATGVDPTLRTAYNDSNFKSEFPYAQVALDSFPQGAQYLKMPEAVEMNETLSLNCSKALSGEISVDEALSTVEDEWTRILEDAGY